MNKKIALSFVFIATVFLLTWCWAKTSQDVTTDAALTDNIAVQWELQQQIDILEAQKSDLSFPSWLSKLNISAPNNMDLDAISSYKTTETVEWFNSIHFVYDWSYDYSMAQAEKIASIANIPVSAEFKMAQDIIDNMDVDQVQMQELLGDMKWIVYTNYSLLEPSDIDYMIAITVNEDGSLELDVTDMIAMQKIADKYTN